MKKKLKKLDLHTETLRYLDDISVERVDGGASNSVACSLCTGPCTVCTSPCSICTFICSVCNTC